MSKSENLWGISTLHVSTKNRHSIPTNLQNAQNERLKESTPSSYQSQKMLRQLASKRLFSQRTQILPRFYHEKVIDHFNNPRNVGSFDKTDPTVGTGLVGAPACGDVMKLQIKVDDTTGEIIDARFKTFGCGSAIASSSVGMFLILLPISIFGSVYFLVEFLGLLLIYYAEC